MNALKYFWDKLLLGKLESPPYEYNFSVNLDEKKYPYYLEKIFLYNTGKKLNLFNPKTFNEKIQWLKLYDTTPQKTMLTDKVLVRDWVKERCGEEVLKPVVWIGQNYSDIPFDKLPDSFVIKTNHGSKWQLRIKSKDKFISNPALQDFAQKKFLDWMTTSYHTVSGFELQYKGIKPQIMIEPLLYDNIDQVPTDIEVYCFNGVPKIYQKVKYAKPNEVCLYDENFNYIDLKFASTDIVVKSEPDEQLKKAVELSKKLASGFKFVRVDWLLYNNKVYFNEMTFTPHSGFYFFEDETWNYKLGQMLDLKK